MQHTVKYAGAAYNASKRGPSQIIWGDCPWVEIVNDPSLGRTFADDFTSFTGTVASNVGKYGQWYSFEDTGGAVSQIATDVNGVVSLVTDTTDNDDIILTTGGNTGGLAIFNTAANSGTKLWFEARVKPAAITKGNWFVGLAEEGLAVTDGIFADAGTLVDKDMVGFAVLEADSAALAVKYNTASGGGITTPSTPSKTLVAGQWYKLGIKYDPETGLTYYIVDETAGTETSNATAIAASATNFPDGEELAIYLGLKNSSGATNTLSCDWVRFAQLNA